MEYINILDEQLSLLDIYNKLNCYIERIKEEGNSGTVYIDKAMDFLKALSLSDARNEFKSDIIQAAIDLFRLINKYRPYFGKTDSDSVVMDFITFCKNFQISRGIIP